MTPDLIVFEGYAFERKPAYMAVKAEVEEIDIGKRWANSIGAE
jgi:hypothetical protein